MRICIWYQLSRNPWGGSNSFLSALAHEFRRLGFRIDSTPKRYDDIVLVNSWSRGRGQYLDYETVREVKEKGFAAKISVSGPHPHPPLIQRLDGMARLYGRIDPQADQIQCAIAKIADFVIFQSIYSRESFFQQGIQPTDSVIIRNAVDGNLYYPSTRQGDLGKEINIIAISWSDNLMKGFSILPKLASLKGVKVYFIGNWNPAVDKGDVISLGVKSKKQVAKILREMDLLAHPAQNDPCANVILEGLASGLPVLFHNSGGNPELASNYGVPLHDDLVASLQEIRNRYLELRERILECRKDFLIEDCAEKYLSVFEKTSKVR
jgi:glycosyltransferase involved in cell wall biosynthesis